MKVWRNLIIGLAVFICLWAGVDFYLSSEIKKNYDNTIDSAYGQIRKDQSTVLQQTSLDRGDVLVLGSSELSLFLEQNVKNFFPTKQFPHYANIIGRTSVQSMEHSMNIASLDFSKNEKVVYLVSYGWFLIDSVDPDGFYANFSKNKFYNYMADFSVPDEQKIYVASRISDLTRTHKNTEDIDAWAYAELCKKCSFALPVIEAVSYPYLMLEQAILNTKDKATSLTYLKEQGPNENEVLKDKDWEKEYQKADSQGIAMVKNNPFYFDDRFTSEVAPVLATQKNIDASMNLEISQEFKDYEVFLQTCKRKNIKPLIIIESVNGWYLDYRGVDKEKRDALYSRLSKMATDYGFTVYDMSDLEYTPYTYYDIWHLGWRGWLYVDQKIAEYFGENS